MPVLLEMAVWDYSEKHSREMLPQGLHKMPPYDSHDHRTVLQALAAMHAKGFIHRDVKTENFCQGAGPDERNVYAVDMGFARPAFGEYHLPS